MKVIFCVLAILVFLILIVKCYENSKPNYKKIYEKIPKPDFGNIIKNRIECVDGDGNITQPTYSREDKKFKCVSECGTVNMNCMDCDGNSYTPTQNTDGSYTCDPPENCGDNNLKKLYHNILEDELKFRLSCFDENGKSTEPIKTKDGWRCRHYYNTTDPSNPAPVYSGKGDPRTCFIQNYSNNFLFSKCKDVNDNGVDCPVTSSYIPCELSAVGNSAGGNMYSAYGDYSPGTISGFRVEHPFNSDAPIFMRVNDILADCSSSLKQCTYPPQVKSIDECESMCASQTTDRYGTPVEGCYSYSMITDANGISNCFINTPGIAGGNVTSFVKS